MCQQPTITFFTVVMNRLHHLSMTLPLNLRDNRAAGTDFLILDYGSTDGVAEYLLEKFPKEIESRRLQFQRVEAKYFDRCHSRNLAAHYASGDVLCNIDADNFTGQNFDLYLSAYFQVQENIFITGVGNVPGIRDAFGKLAVRRQHFFAVQGYNETFKGYGYEDYDLVQRLEERGLDKIVINDQQYLQAIAHEPRERIRNEWHINNLSALYTQYISDRARVLLYLYTDQTLEYGIVLSNDKGFRYSLAGRKWQTGNWAKDNGQLRLRFSDFDCSLDIIEDKLCGRNHFLRKETDPEKIEEAIVFNTEIANRYRLQSTPYHPNLQI